ncbi:hypothetical protein KLP40_11490 [Hymenobacter sp. NST-14]|uniref:hypothetical protein n=1 Tax=Hymenobacter piscis TaxID=2839984 RepID=UPI001C0312A4|nr:hypothetical protein [Hymenobacter piscis]MBT9393786.1 hypothetical protein [Hymenobacter piscis]
MGVQFELVNLDKEEVISFAGIDAGNKMRELAGTIVTSNIVTWYLLQNIGDRISFVNDTNESHVLFGRTYSKDTLAAYRDVTHQSINQLIDAGILRQAGNKMVDEEEGLSYQVLLNIWDPAIPSNK